MSQKHKRQFRQTGTPLNIQDTEDHLDQPSLATSDVVSGSPTPEMAPVPPVSVETPPSPEQDGTEVVTATEPPTTTAVQPTAVVSACPAQKALGAPLSQRLLSQDTREMIYEAKEALQEKTTSLIRWCGRSYKKWTDKINASLAVDSPETIAFHRARGNHYLAKGKFDLAILHYKKIVATSRATADDHAKLGIACFKTKLEAEAITCLDKALELNPNNVEASLYRGLVFFAQSDLDQAGASLEKVIALGPNHATAHYRLGLVHDAKGNPEAAIGSLTRAIELDPANDLCHYTAGLVYEKLGQQKEAIAAFKKALEIRGLGR